MIVTQDKTITLPKAFTRIDYVVMNVGFGIGGVAEQFIENKTVSGFRTRSHSSNYVTRTHGWYACGY